MSRKIALLACLLLIPCATAAAKPADDACAQNSPYASPCIGAGKLAEGAAAECRKAGAPDSACVMPAGRDVLAAERDAYLASWGHGAVQFQYRLGNPLPLRDAQWLGTHNSFNSFANGETPSHLDSNQQLTLGQQLDVDVRSLELDLHWVPNAQAGGNAVVVCHGLDPDQADGGCTTEPRLVDVLPELAGWLNAHPDQVLLLYLEDNLADGAGYAQAVAQLDAGLQRDDGSSLLYRPGAPGAGGDCAELPLDRSRDDVLAAGAQVVLVGRCRPGWAADVFGWDDNHVESGSTPGYQAFPACDATYGPDVYATELVRYYEDSTWVTATSGAQSPADHEAEALTPARVAAMTSCGVNLFGFDQLLPGDGRLQASIWSWAENQPDPAAGACTVQGADGRWRSESCRAVHPAACRTAPGNWTLSRAVTAAGAPKACRRQGAAFALPRSGEQNSLLRAAARSAVVWLDYRAA